MSTANEQIQRVRTLFGEDWVRFAEQGTGCAPRTGAL